MDVNKKYHNNYNEDNFVNDLYYMIFLNVSNFKTLLLLNFIDYLVILMKVILITLVYFDFFFFVLVKWFCDELILNFYFNIIKLNF